MQKLLRFIYITLPHSPHLPDNSVLAITGGGVGGAVGGALLLVVGVLLCTLIMKLKLLHSATDNSQGKLHDQLFVQHVKLVMFQLQFTFMFSIHPIMSLFYTSNMSSYRCFPNGKK